MTLREPKNVLNPSHKHHLFAIQSKTLVERGQGDGFALLEIVCQSHDCHTTWPRQPLKSRDLWRHHHLAIAPKEQILWLRRFKKIVIRIFEETCRESESFYRQNNLRESAWTKMDKGHLFLTSNMAHSILWFDLWIRMNKTKELCEKCFV